MATRHLGARRRGAVTVATFLIAVAITFLGVPGGPIRDLAGPGPARAQVTLPLPGLSSTTTAASPSSEVPSSSTSTEPESTTTVTEAPPTETSETSVPETSSEPSTELAVAPVSSLTSTSLAVTRTPTRTALSTAPASSISAALTGSYGLAVATVFVIAIGLFGLAVRATTGGGLPLTELQRRWRLAAGFGCLGAAAIVGLIGYLRLSLEPAVNRQIPYLASAGMALVILAAAGGSLIIAEQLRRDDGRLDELEAAVRSLASTLSPMIEAPARHETEPSAAGEPEDPEASPSRRRPR